MTVKDLVQKYESSASLTTNGCASTQSNGPRPRLDDPLVRSAEVDVSLDQLPPPRLARFVKRPESGEVPTPHTHLSGALPPSTISATCLTILNNEDIFPTSAKTSLRPFPLSLSTLTPQGSQSRSQHPRFSRTLPITYDADEQESLVKHLYPPESPWSDGNGISLKSSYSASQYPRHLLFHKPIPAPIVFSRAAFPLSLPKLDNYISKLSTPPLGKDSERRDGMMFPPLDQLAKIGLSLDDLETNATVPPAWRNRTSILGASSNALIGFLGSSALASFYSLQGLINTVQIFALILSTIVPVGGTNDLGEKWRGLFLGTIPNVLALNFASVLVQSLIFLAVFIFLAGILLYYFHRSTTRCDRYNSIEGLQQTETKGNQWGLLIVTFLLTTIYLPLSTMSVHVLVWSEELWAVPNPYKNATGTPNPIPLGPANEFRDPLDFCWTTTMKRNEVNLAPLVVALAAMVFIFFTLWFPIALRRVIKRSVPKVEKFTELGRRRSKADLDAEYHRLLGRDRNPFAFLYNGFRRGWGTYISTYLFAKLSTLLIVAVIDPDNCFFRAFSRTTIPIVRQCLLLVSTLSFFLAQSIFAPFLDPVNNASEWTSRLNYLSTSLTALVITLNVPGKDIFDTYVLYSIYILTYGLGFYFTLVNFGWMQRIIKRLARRIDFSLDIFSPRLDTSPTSVHTKRRIWQESISTLFLTDPECHIPAKQAMAFAQARDSEYPPYLLDFMGTPAERHVENLKILRDVGLEAYNKAVALTTGPDFAWYRHLEGIILKNFVGPDSYWERPGKSVIPNCSSFFGNAWWIPFPPALVIRYDEGPCAVLTAASEFEAYISQNSSVDIQRRRYIRMSLRALEGQIIRWPYEHIQDVGTNLPWCCGRNYSAVTSRQYQHAVLRIKRRGHLIWKGLPLGSGFTVELRYSKKVKVSGEVIGLNEDYDLTSSLARFLEINRELVDQGLRSIEGKLSEYRQHHRKECRWKSRVLTYRFLTSVYDKPRDPDTIAQSCLDLERDTRVCQLMSRSEPVFRSAYDRLAAVSTSEAATWWYIFWDDLWRRNHDTISGLQKHACDFNPHYKASIAYTPLSRPALESFLTQRGLLHKKPHLFDFFHTGFLNKLYLRLNDAVFRNSRRAVMFHLGNDRRELDMEDVDVLTQAQSSTLGTGGGTDHDVSGIRARPTYRWEGLLDDPPRNGGHEGRRKWLAKLKAWFGITPLWRAGWTSNGLSLDVKLQDGRYVLLVDGASSSATSPTTTTRSPGAATATATASMHDSAQC